MHPRLLLGALPLVAAALVIPSCGPETCPSGVTKVCLEDGTTCVCPTPCTTFKDCAAADPTTPQFCSLDNDVKGCLPAAFFPPAHCDQGASCVGSCSSGGCLPYCTQSSDCESGCCYFDPDARGHGNSLAGTANPMCVDSKSAYSPYVQYSQYSMTVCLGARPAGAGTGGSGAAGVCMDADGYPVPPGRFAVVDPGVGPTDGSGLVKDSHTNLVWARFMYLPTGGVSLAEVNDYCKNQGARLPTMDEAVAIAGIHTDSCAWPESWDTWTSTGAGDVHLWAVRSDGYTYTDSSANGDGKMLCVR